jgi:hypothetical protein
MARRAALLAVPLLAVIGLVLSHLGSQLVLRIQEWPNGATLVARRVQPGDRFMFGWEHSLEKIPWDEFYHLDAAGNLVLDTIRFPAFGAGIPEARGKSTWTRDGMIYLGQIDKPFPEIAWLNSTTATKQLKLNDRVIAEGRTLPASTRLLLTVGPRWP